MSVLIVDDSPESRFALRRALVRAGFETQEAGTGAEGLAAAAGGAVELVLLDVNLPDIDGFEVCRRLRLEAPTAHIPVLLISAARIDSDAQVAGLEAGADSYLIDPVDPGVLVATVRALLRLRAAEDGLRRQVEDAETLRALSSAFADAITQDDVIRAVLARAPAALDAVGAALYLVSETTGRVSLARHAGAVAAEEDVRDDVLAVVTSGAPRFSADGEGARAVLPLAAYWRRVGAIVVTFGADRDPDDATRGLLLAIAERCAMALERTRLYEDQREIATTLQRSLLPDRLPRVPGADIGVRYASGTQAMEVGGDFYDVFARPDDWIAIVGDVCGRGASAAALTSLARHTVRAHARYLEAPSAILGALGAAVCAELHDERESFLTAACARLRPAGEGLDVTLAVGGHPPPMVVRGDGRVEPITIHGPLLGMAELDLQTPDVEVRLEPGDALVLYTDGVLEARVPGGQFGEARLAELLGTTATRGLTAPEIAAAVLDAVIDGAVHDDIAVLVVQLAPQPAVGLARPQADAAEGVSGGA